MDGIPLARRQAGARLRLGIRIALLSFSSCAAIAQMAASGSNGSASPSAVQFQILDQRTVNFGQHSVILNRIAPPTFPVPTPTPVPPTPPLFAHFMSATVFATVYDGQYTVFGWFGDTENVIAVSNVNFDYLGGLYGFVQGDDFYQLTPFLEDASSSNADPQITAWLAQARSALSPTVPGFIIVSGNASPDFLQTLNAVHSYFAHNSASIISSYTQRQAAYAASELQAKLHPAPRPNTVINYWKIK
jgi:hypothetical protein